MYLFVMAGMASLVAALFLTPLVRNIATRIELLDQPDLYRKVHSHAVPRLGGVAIFCAYFAALGSAFLISPSGSRMDSVQMDLIWKLFPAAAVIFATGLIDDVYGLKPWQKLVGQIAAAFIAFAAGVHLDSISGYHLSFGLTIPMTVFWLVICTNAFNLIDGVDGLAAGVGLFATVTTLAVALFHHNAPLAMATIPLAGALLGFLRYNFNPASIHLGDSGSLLIGFLLGCYAVVWTGKAATVLGITAPLMMLAVPLMDTAIAVVRRYLRAKPIFGADRGHIHHRLLAQGLTPRRVVVTLYAICALCGFLSLMQSIYHQQFGGVIGVVFCAGVYFGVRHLGYSEFDAARRLVFSGRFRQMVNAEIQLIGLREALAAAKTPDECWDILHHSYGDFGFSEITLRFHDRTWQHSRATEGYQSFWAIRIVLSEVDYINLTHESGTGDHAPVITAFADVVGNLLRSRLDDMPAPIGAQPQPVVGHAVSTRAPHLTA